MPYVLGTPNGSSRPFCVTATLGAEPAKASLGQTALVLLGLGAAGLIWAGSRNRRAKALGEAPPCSLWKSIRSGPKGEVVAYVGPTGRCQPCEFLDETPKPMRKKIDREFDYIVNRPNYWSMHFHPLANSAPLWKLKVFDHRLYGVPESSGNLLRFILLRGFVKDKTRSKEQEVQIATSHTLYREYMKRRTQCIGR